jgi:hypothetical protein
MNCEFMDVINSKVGKLVVFCVTPATLYGVGVWRIRREMERFKSWIPSKESFHQLGAVNPSSIPYQFHSTRDPLPEFAKKGDYLLSRKIFFGGKKVENHSWPLGIATENNGSDCRDLAPPVPNRKLRSLSAGRQCAFSNGEKLETRFIKKNYGRTLVRRFFLISGSVSSSHLATLAGSRSLATFSGLWKDHCIFSVRILNT